MTPGVAARFPRAGLATPHYLASGAGAAELARGGNAIDAIIAANLALGVVAPYLCGYGGDLFAIVWDGELHGYLGSGRSPARATIEIVSELLAEEPLLVGPHSVTVPGAIAGWFDLLERFGTRSFADLARDAIRYARDGFELTPMGAFSCTAYGGLYRGLDDWHSVYGSLEPGDVLRQPALARLIELLAEAGPDAYYRGVVAEAIATALQAGGGLMDVDDLEVHAGEWAAPMRAKYRDVEIAELPPPTQGVAVLEIMRILDGFELGALEPADRAHLIIEAVKIGLRDRDDHVTDPAHATVPPEALLAEEWVTARRAAIDPNRAQLPLPGHPQRGGTAYLCAADDDGLLVSLIQSNFLAFGSGVHVPEWGINLNNRGSSFTLDESRVNALAPSKRPMHTLIPAMVLRDGSPSLVFGSMGGDAQAQVHAQLLTQIVDDGLDPQAAIDAPRGRVEPLDWKLRVERRTDPLVLVDLAARGHELIETMSYDPGMGHAHAIAIGTHGYAVATD
ncbi:MAG: gamma-glutamyltransferase family protein, partial [Acidimicrobiia bacterium]